MRLYNKCSLCGMDFDPDDLLFEVRKLRHQEIHKRSGASKNKIFGFVKWI